MSITRIAPERCSIACSPESEQGRRSRSRGRSTTAFTPDWTSGRRFGLLNEARAPNGGRPTLRAGIVLTLPRWTRCRLRLKPAVRASLDSTTIPARCAGRRGHAPKNLPARWRASERWGVQRFAAPPEQPIGPAGAGPTGLGGLDALAPRHALRGAAPLRHRLDASDCATLSCEPGVSGRTGQMARQALCFTVSSGRQAG
jgi:hypothetical protein